MRTKDHWLYLKDQLPAIGSGWRYVTVKLGRKWAYFVSKEGPTVRRGKMLLKSWKRLEVSMLKYHKRNGCTSRDTFKGEIT